MPLAHSVVLEQEIPGLDLAMSGEALALADLEDQEGTTTTLSAIAQCLDVTPLPYFFSGSREKILELLGDDPANPPEETTSILPPEVWYDPQQGLQTVQALIPFLQEHPDAVPQSMGVLDDLADVQRILTAAQAQGMRWHLTVTGVNEGNPFSPG